MTSSLNNPVPAGPLLVGVSEDERSDGAIAQALDLGRRCALRVELLHVLADGEGLLPRHDASEELVAVQAYQAERLTGAFDAQVVEHLSVRSGRPAHDLVRHARTMQAGLIVLGPHRRRGLFDLGRSARAVLTHAPCPVWIQPGPAAPVNRIVAPIDLSDDSASAALWARGLAHTLGAELELLSAFEPPTFAYPAMANPPGPTYVVDEAREQQRAQLERLAGELDVPCRLVEGDPVQVIRDAPGDLVVMACHGRGALSAALLGSVTQAVLRDAERPTVALRHASRLLDLDGEGS